MSRYQYHTPICSECGQEFKSNRADARTCSVACRKRRARRKEEVRRLGVVAVLAVRQLQQYADRRLELRALCGQQLSRVQQEIAPALVRWPDLAALCALQVKRVPHLLAEIKGVTEAGGTEKHRLVAAAWSLWLSLSPTGIDWLKALAAGQPIANRNGATRDSLELKGLIRLIDRAAYVMEITERGRALLRIIDTSAQLSEWPPDWEAVTTFTGQNALSSVSVTHVRRTENPSTDDPAAIMRAAGVPELFELEPAKSLT